MASTASSSEPVAFTSAHSRSFTTMEAVRRLSPRAAGARLASGGDGVLRLLLLGADRAEGTSPAETAAVFEGLLRCLSLIHI